MSQYNQKLKVIDLRWLSDVNVEGLAREIGDCRNLLVVEECRKTGSMSEFLVAGLVEKMPTMPKTLVVAADDCFIPLGKAAAAGLPKQDEIVKGALSLLKLSALKETVMQ